MAGNTPVLVHNCGGASVISDARLGHIEYRHGPGAQDMARKAGERNIPGEFSEDFLWNGDNMALGTRLRAGVDSSPELPNPNGPGHIHQFDYGSPVGVDGAGRSTSRVEVVVRDGNMDSISEVKNLCLRYQECPILTGSRSPMVGSRSALVGHLASMYARLAIRMMCQQNCCLRWKRCWVDRQLNTCHLTTSPARSDGPSPVLRARYVRLSNRMMSGGRRRADIWNGRGSGSI